MRTDIIIATDKYYNEQIVRESDVTYVPNIGDIVLIGDDRYKVVERMFQYHPELKNIRVCDCWIRVEKTEE